MRQPIYPSLQENEEVGPEIQRNIWQPPEPTHICRAHIVRLTEIAPQTAVCTSNLAYFSLRDAWF